MEKCKFSLPTLRDIYASVKVPCIYVALLTFEAMKLRHESMGAD